MIDRFVTVGEEPLVGLVASGVSALDRFPSCGARRSSEGTDVCASLSSTVKVNGSEYPIELRASNWTVASPDGNSTTITPWALPSNRAGISNERGAAGRPSTRTSMERRSSLDRLSIANVRAIGPGAATTCRELTETIVGGNSSNRGAAAIGCPALLETAGFGVGCPAIDLFPYAPPDGVSGNSASSIIFGRDVGGAN